MTVERTPSGLTRPLRTNSDLNNFWTSWNMKPFLECREKRSEFRLGSAFFGISDPGLVKKGFFETFLSKKMTGGGGNEISEIFKD